MRPVDAIEALLPQTQCGECGYPGCRPYAEALAQDAAPIDRCPPGGLATLKALGQFLGKDSKPFETPMQQRQRAPALASIREEECIGCTKCIQACPVDAIIGSAKHMHSIIRHECTGCGLCVEPCPVDCIDLLDLKQEGYDRNEAKAHHEARQNRLLKEKQALEAAYQQKRHLAKQSEDAKGDREAKNNYILKAMARVKAKKHE